MVDSVTKQKYAPSTIPRSKRNKNVEFHWKLDPKKNIYSNFPTTKILLFRCKCTLLKSIKLLLLALVDCGLFDCCDRFRLDAPY